MTELLTQPDAWLALFTLTLLELVLGIDNIVFIAILTAKLPKEQQGLAYKLGLGGALVTRLLLLLAINWIVHLTEPIDIFGFTTTGRGLILLGGGLFLIAKSAHEIFEQVEAHEDEQVEGWGNSMASVVGQIMVLDVIFSLDSVITAVGMVEQVEIMMAAIILAVITMLFFAKPVGDFVNQHPSMKILALAFLLLIGVVLVMDGFGQHVSKNYIYAAMGFALVVELLNMRFRKRRAIKPDEKIPTDHLPDVTDDEEE